MAQTYRYRRACCFSDADYYGTASVTTQIIKTRDALDEECAPKEDHGTAQIQKTRDALDEECAPKEDYEDNEVTATLADHHECDEEDY